MSQFTFSVRLDESLRRGKSCPTAQPVTIEIDPAALDQADRDLIASRMDGDIALHRRSEEHGGLCTSLLLAPYAVVYRSRATYLPVAFNLASFALGATTRAASRIDSARVVTSDTSTRSLSLHHVHSGRWIARSAARRATSHAAYSAR